jgi:hypothetical protein
MVSIGEIVQQAITTGHLTIEAENQLRQLLQTTKYGLEDVKAFMNLQQSAMTGQVRQESREIRCSQYLMASSSSHPEKLTLSISEVGSSSFW